MGLALSLFATDATDNGLIGKSLSDAIYIYIAKHIKQVSHGLYDKNITYLCMKYIGFIMYSQILNINDQWKSYKIISNHHKSHGIQSPLITPNHICYIKSIYSYSYNDDDDSRYYRFTNEFLKNCMNKPHLLVVFYTRFFHVYCMYFRMPLNKAHICDNDASLYLLRTLNEEEYMPRVIKRLDMNEPTFSHTPYFRIGNVVFFSNHPSISFTQYEVSLEEQFGPPKDDDDYFDIAYNQIEVFQLF